MKTRSILILVVLAASLISGQAGAQTTMPPRDLRIDEVAAPAKMALGDVLTFRVKITNHLTPRLRTALYLHHELRRTSVRVAERKIELGYGQSVVRIATICRTVGRRTFQVRLARHPGESDLANNAATVNVEVNKVVVRALLIAGAPSREYLFLVPALTRDPVVKLAAYLQPADIDYRHQGNVSVPRLPGMIREWERYDVVILLDADPKRLTERQVAALEETVRRGAGLVLAPGRAHPLAQWFKVHGKRMKALCPVTLPMGEVPDRGRSLTKPFRVARTALGKNHSILVASSLAKNNERIWSDLEGTDFYRAPPTTYTPRPGAVSLLRRKTDGDERGAPLVALRRHGEGTVLLQGLESTWRWRFPAENYDHERFWSRTIRYLGESRRRDEAKPAAEPLPRNQEPAFLILPRPAFRPDMGRLLTPQVKKMTKKALGYLCAKQHANGGWDDKKFPNNTGVTALCCLALMAEGNLPNAGPHGKALDRGLAFLLSNVQTSGVIVSKNSNKYGPAYEHVLSLIALSMAYGDLPHRPNARDVIARAVQALARCQRLDGGWRYQFSREGDSDASVTSIVLHALRAARKAGITVDNKMLAKGVRFLERCALPDGTFRYRMWGLHASTGIQGAAAMALCVNGRVHPLVAPARDATGYRYRRYTVADLRKTRYAVYETFHAGRLMYTCGDTYWVPWWRKATAVLATLQQEKGSFGDQTGNTVYPTAMAATVLQAPLGYLPLFER